MYLYSSFGFFGKKNMINLEANRPLFFCVYNMSKELNLKKNANRPQIIYKKKHCRHLDFFHKIGLRCPMSNSSEILQLAFLNAFLQL